MDFLGSFQIGLHERIFFEIILLRVNSLPTTSRSKDESISKNKDMVVFFLLLLAHRLGTFFPHGNTRQIFKDYEFDPK